MSEQNQLLARLLGYGLVGGWQTVWGKSDQTQANGANHALYAQSVAQYPCGFADIA